MRITTRLTLLAACITLTLAVLLPALVWSFLAFQEAQANHLFADQIELKFLERTSFRDQYFLYREPRMQAMWEQNKVATDRLLDQAGARFRTPGDLEQVNRLRRYFAESEALFLRIVGNTPALGTAGPHPVYEEYDKRLSSQLLLKAAAVHDTLSTLRETNELRVEKAFRRLALLVGLLGITSALATALALRHISRLIDRRLAPLHTGVKTIAEGHLDHRLGLAGSDEFTELGRSIDAMAAKLQASTSLLEEEISRRLLLTARQESEARFRAWFELPILGISITSAEQSWLEVNDHLVEMLGYGRAELAAMTWADLTHPDDLAADLVQFERVLKGEIEGYSLEKRFLLKNGEVLPAELAVRCVRKADGAVDYFVALIQDITERKQAERERHALAERMSQAQRLEALGVLVAGVAHNINNVLAAIMTTASTHEKLTTGAEDLEAYRTIGTACRRGREVVKSLTHFARPTLAQSAPLELGALLGEVRALLENTTRSQIQVIQPPASEPLWILGNAGSISHALMNLCLNSLDAMPDGGTLTFRSAAEADWVEVAIEDTGAGMAPEILARVREPFFTTKEVGQGTGLGLSMVHGVVKAHAGTMDIASVPGQGTTVTLRFPRIPAPAAEPPVAAVEPPVTSSRSLTMLLVDDDADVRFLVARMLRRAGHSVRTVPGGKEALESLGSDGLPDLVILDQNMPKMNGIQTMDQIRARYPRLPILISSGQPDIEEWECFRQENVAVISKPFELDEILAKLAAFAALDAQS